MNSISTKSEEELHKENILKEDIQNEINLIKVMKLMMNLLYFLKI